MALFRRKGCIVGAGSVLLLSSLVLFWLLWPDVEDLIAASTRNDASMINICLICGVDVNGKEKWGWYRKHDGRTPLTAAVQRGSVSTISRLIQAGAGVNFPDGFGERPAWTAAVRGEIEIITLLSEQGADFSVIYLKKSTVEIAIAAGHTKAAEEIQKILAAKAGNI